MNDTLPQLKDSKHLENKACRLAAANPGFWLRGVIPRGKRRPQWTTWAAGTTHTVESLEAPRLRCTTCCTEASKHNRALLKTWLTTPCEGQPRLGRQSGGTSGSSAPVVARARVVSLGGSTSHPTHTIVRYMQDCECWYGTACWHTGLQNLSALAAPCTRFPSRTGLQNRSRLLKGLMLGQSALATEFNRGKAQYAPRPRKGAGCAKTIEQE